MQPANNMEFDFKKMAAQDRLVFLNLKEFGEEHAVDGKKIAAVLDSDILKENPNGQSLTVAGASLVLYAAIEDLPLRRPSGEGLNVDGREYLILDWSEDMGIAAVSLDQNITM